MRYHHLDFLRGTLMVAGVILHTCLVVNTDISWRIETESTSDVYGYIHSFIHSFRMEG
jgi:uncharacterized membrane protein